LEISQEPGLDPMVRIAGGKNRDSGSFTAAPMPLKELLAVTEVKNGKISPLRYLYNLNKNSRTGELN
jgi:hypothetical protein